MAFLFKNDMTKGINLDLDELRLPPNAAVFIKNITQNSAQNPGSNAGAGSNQYINTPLEGNAAISGISLPSGNNFCVGFYSSEQTNEGYFFVYNSTTAHTIWVISGDDGSATKVYQGALLPFILDPKYFIAEGCCTLELRNYIDPVTGIETEYKFLIFTNDNIRQYLIEVNSSIATSSFSTSFFTASAAFYNQAELIHLGVPTPLTCIGLNTPTAYTPQTGDDKLQNLVVRNGWQFRQKHIDIFGRESEHGIISNQFITIAGGGCASASNGLPRCVNLNIDAGNPLVAQVQIEFRKWVGNDAGGSLATGWMICETFNKYDNSPGTKWYNRAINPLFTTPGSGITYNAGTNKFVYTFCADKHNIPIDPNETIRTEPQLPRTSKTVFALNKRIGLGNNVRNFEPIDPVQINKVTYSVQPPGQSGCPAPPLRTVIIYAKIWTPLTNNLYAMIRMSYGKWVWGNSDGPCGAYGSYSLDQVFADQATPGFIGYMAGMAGSSYAVVSEQGDIDPATGAFTPGMSFPHCAILQFKLSIPAGKYIFRIASHHAKITDANFQRTSTQVAGVVKFSDLASPIGMYNYPQNPDKEMEIDCTGGDVILNGPGDPFFVIMDAGDAGVAGTDSSSVCDGYLYEDDQGDTPIEMNPIGMAPVSMAGTPIDGFGSYFTDHNGYYFVISNFRTWVKISSDVCDGAGFVYRFMYGTTGPGMILHGDGTNTATGACLGVHGAWDNKIYLFKTPNKYPSAGRRLIKQRIAICGTPLTGVPGIPIIISKGQVALTDSNGKAIIVAHNRYNYNTFFTARGSSSLPNYGTSPGNTDRLIFSQKGGCQWSACGGCDPFLADVVIAYKACGVAASGCSGSEPDRTLCLTDVQVNVVGSNIRGIQSGGRYAVGFVLHDEIGRHTFVQMAQGNAKFVNAPNLNDTSPSPYPSFSLCQIAFNIAGAVFPTYFTKMTFCVTPNLVFSDFISWAADWIEKVDNTGTRNDVNPTQIRIYYGSLNEYNKQNNEGTNTAWDFITKGQNNATAPVEGDIVQFIMNGDGTWFPSVISAVVTYAQSGLFFTIDYTNDLVNLMNGALYKVIRPIENQEDYLFYEQCFTIKLTNGVPNITSGVIPYIDSYINSRLLPVPIMKGQPGAIPPGAAAPNPIQYTSSNNNAALDAAGYGTNNVNNSNGVVIMEVKDAQTSYPFFFESPSPSDTWGSHMASRGRVMVANPFEAQARLGTEIALSASLGDRPNGLNGLSYFESQFAQIFDKNTWGNIMCVLVETGICLVICDRDHFLISFNNQQLKVGEGGIVQAQNSYGVFSAPERKGGTCYGCAPGDINTIRRYAGRVCWMDSAGYLIFHDFRAAIAVQENGYSSWLKNKISLTNIKNLVPGTNGLTYFVGGIDPKTWEYYLTSFVLPQGGGALSFINTESAEKPSVNETIYVDLDKGILKGFASFTPELYGLIPGFYSQPQFIAFKNGKPYIHHFNRLSGTPPAYANFFGTQCEVRLTIVVNPSAEKVKNFLYNEVYVKETVPVTGNFSKPLFICDVITTEKGQLSRLLTPFWRISEGFAMAAFLCDLNTIVDPSRTIIKLIDGDPLKGRWMKVSYTSQSDWNGIYFELSGIDNYVTGIEKGDG